MRLRNRRILKQVFCYSKSESYRTHSNGYLNEDHINNSEFDLQKYLLVDSLSAKLPNISNGKVFLTFFIKPWAIIFLMMATIGIRLLMGIPLPHATPIFINGLQWSLLWIPVVLLYNLAHGKAFFKYCRLRYFIYMQERNQKYRYEDEAVAKMIGDNVKLQRRLKLDKLK